MFPFVLKIDDSSQLQIVLSRLQRVLAWYVMRGLPLLVTGLLGMAMYIGSRDFPWSIWVGLGGIALFMGYLFQKKYMLEALITPYAVEIKYNNLLGAKEMTILVQDIDHIQKSKEAYGRGSRVVYRLILREGEAVELMLIPTTYSKFEAKIQHLESRISQITQRQIL